MKSLLILNLVAIFFLFSLPSVAPAKCLHKMTLYCVDLEITGRLKPFKGPAKGILGRTLCELEAKIKMDQKGNTNKVSVVIIRDQPCPKKGDKLIGNLSYLCQDTGQWTAAEYRFEHEDKSYCEVSHQARLVDVRKKAARVDVGVSHDEVAKLFPRLGTYHQSSGVNEYYEHPAIVIRVKFDRLAREGKVVEKPRVTRKANDQYVCEKLEGKWGRMGLMAMEQCNLPSLDKGKECSSSDQCESACHTMNKIMPGQPSEGRCYGWTSTLGTCLTRVEGGIVQSPLCVD